MPSVILWNIRRTNAKDEILALAAEYSPEIICIIEPPDHDDLMDLVPANYNLLRNVACEKVRIITTLPAEYIIFRAESSRVMCFHYRDSLSEFLFAGVHLVDQGNYDLDDRIYVAGTTKSFISDIEKKRSTNRTLIVGDFNADPYDKSMVSANGFHAISDIDLAIKRRKRKIQSQENDIYYNPCWHYNNIDGAKGTYYFDRSGHVVNYFWHNFDQVILNPSIAKKFNQSSLKIIDQINNKKIKLSRKKFPDHYPIYFEVNV